MTAQDEVRITRLTDLGSGLESVCMSPSSFQDLVAPLCDDVRDLVVHCLLAASGLLAQVCCASPPRQPFSTFTTWVEYARILETLPSPVGLSIPSASALHLLLHWLKSTSPFPKFLQVRIPSAPQFTFPGISQPGNSTSSPHCNNFVSCSVLLCTCIETALDPRM